jgi:hypothetical protein
LVVDLLLHGQSDLPFFEVNLEHSHLNLVSWIYDSPGILHEGIAQLRDVYETILVYPDIDESSEIRHVRDHARAQHSRLQV